MPDQTKVHIQKNNTGQIQEGKRPPEPILESLQGLSIKLMPFVEILGTSTTKPPLDIHVDLLSDSRLSHRANAIQRALIVNKLQFSYGNDYVQRVVNLVHDRKKNEFSTDIKGEIAGEKGYGQLLEPKSCSQMTNYSLQYRPKENTHQDKNFLSHGLKDVLQQKGGACPEPTTSLEQSRYKQESDNLADTVMRMPELQRQQRSEIKDLEKPYPPGNKWSKRYHKLPPELRAEVNKEVNDWFYKVYPEIERARRLDWSELADRPMARAWLRLRDRVMQSPKWLDKYVRLISKPLEQLREGGPSKERPVTEDMPEKTEEEQVEVPWAPAESHRDVDVEKRRKHLSKYCRECKEKGLPPVIKKYISKDLLYTSVKKVGEILGRSEKIHVNIPYHESGERPIGESPSTGYRFKTITVNVTTPFQVNVPDIFMIVGYGPAGGYMVMMKSSKLEELCPNINYPVIHGFTSIRLDEHLRLLAKSYESAFGQFQALAVEAKSLSDEAAVEKRKKRLKKYVSLYEEKIQGHYEKEDRLFEERMLKFKFMQERRHEVYEALIASWKKRRETWVDDLDEITFSFKKRKVSEPDFYKDLMSQLTRSMNRHIDAKIIRLKSKIRKIREGSKFPPVTKRKPPKTKSR